MRIAMMQMAMTEDMERNLQVSYEAVKEAAGVDLLFFPEVQHMPFLPQYTADELPDYLLGKSAMVHVTSAPQFYELDYYTPSPDGFRVYDTSFGKIGVVICFDRHLPESIRTCAAMGAELVLIPTANLTTEPLDLFEWEIRVQAYQNNVFIAMCNRVGREGDVTFAGQSLVVDSEGQTLFKAGGEAGLVYCDIDLEKCKASRQARPYITLRRPEFYR